MPFSFPAENVKEGMKIFGMCAVSAGDPPFHISWLKDGRQISSSDTDTTIQMIGQDFSSLTIDTAKTRHSGHYTCVVKNDVATVNYTAVLTIHGTKKLLFYFIYLYFILAVPYKNVFLSLDGSSKIHGNVITTQCFCF